MQYWLNLQNTKINVLFHIKSLKNKKKYDDIIGTVLIKQTKKLLTASSRHSGFKQFSEVLESKKTVSNRVKNIKKKFKLLQIK